MILHHIRIYVQVERKRKGSVYKREVEILLNFGETSISDSREKCRLGITLP
jgi:hypothetical protein